MLRSATRFARLKSASLASSTAHSTTNNEPLRVCACSQDEWKALVNAAAAASDETHSPLPQHLKYDDSALVVHGCADLVQAKRVAQCVERALGGATATGFQHLECRSSLAAGEPSPTLASAAAADRDTESSSLPGLATLCAAFAFGSAREMQSLGTELPPTLSDWRCFETIRGEVSVQPDWTELDARAEQYACAPGVKYVLCIRIAPHTQVDSSGDGDTRVSRAKASVAEYKLHTINRDADVAVVSPMLSIGAMPIDSPATFVSFDAHHALGLSPTAVLPKDFASPIVLDLFAAVHDACETTLETTAP